MTGVPAIEPTDPVMEEAMAWRLRHEEGPLPPADRAAFDAWMRVSDRNRESYEHLERFWTATSAMDRHPRYARLLQQTESVVHRGRLTRRALAASFAAFVIGAGGWGAYSQLAPRPLADQSFKTAVGQRATVTLPDGTQVMLNTDTVMRTSAADDKRLVYLDQGQAFFKVAKDRHHPFVVTAGGRTVTALGTAFDVRIDKGELKVVLVEGKVRVEAAGPPAATAQAGGRPSGTRARPMTTEMSPGSQLVARDDTEWRLTPTNVDIQTSWVRGQLVFAGAPLSEVIDEMNRYSTRKIALADPALGNRRIGGNFTPGDVQGFARILAAAGVARLQEQRDGRILVVATSTES